MGHINQLLFLKDRLPKRVDVVVEVGSRDVGSGAGFRRLFPAEVKYVGVDQEPGPWVDVVRDMELPWTPDYQADLVICCSMLEHTPRPWVVAPHLEMLLRPGGTLYLSVPWVWRYHPYPDDYFRFSWRAIESLFHEIAWSEFLYSTYIEGEFFKCENGADGARAIHDSGGRKFLPYLEIHAIGTKR